MIQSLAGFSVYDVSSGKLSPKVLLVSVCMMSALARYDQSLAGFSVYDVSSGKLFTSTGMQFHHIFNLSLCGGATNHPPVICRNNISSSAVRTFLYDFSYFLYK